MLLLLLLCHSPGLLQLPEAEPIRVSAPSPRRLPASAQTGKANNDNNNQHTRNDTTTITSHTITATTITTTTTTNNNNDHT